MSAAEDIALRQAFFSEAVDIVDRLEVDLAAVGADPANLETVNAVFRGLHTIKGNSSFLNLENITKLSHAAEALLDMARKKTLPVTPGMLQLVSTVLGHLRLMIGDQNTDLDVTHTITLLQKFMRGDKSATAEPVASSVNPAAKAPQKISLAPMIRIDEKKVTRIVSLVSDLELTRYALEKVMEKLSDAGLGSMDLQVELDAAVSRVSRITKSLNGIVLGVRLVPINQVFQRFPPVVKDLAAKLGKNIQLQIFNGEAELDKNIVESIADPLTHLIRNSADHGIETVIERKTANKNPVGTIRLNSYVQENFVYVEIADDGRGIDGDKVLRKAVEKGIVPVEKAPDFTHAQKLGLIFAPGFSTAEKVTDISGRGVGMDVVKANINKMKGTVLIDSKVGKGTLIQLRFPMSMVLLFSLFVKIHDTMCSFPVDQLNDSYDYSGDELLNQIPEGANRNDYLALYSLNSLLWGEETPVKAHQKFHVLNFKEKRGKGMGFVVDDFSSIEEAIVQSVDTYISALPGIQGASIRKDGHVALVLNAQNIIELAKKIKPFAYVRLKKLTETGLAPYLSVGGTN